MVDYQPKILKNNTKKVVEFMCGGQIIIFEVGERKPLDGFTAYHALFQVNTGLTDVTDEPEEVEEVSSKTKTEEPLPYKTMSWKELFALARKNKLSRKLDRGQIIKKLVKLDEQKSGNAEANKKAGRTS